MILIQTNGAWSHEAQSALYRSVTFHISLLQYCPCSGCRLRFSGRTGLHVHYTGRGGSWESPSDLPGTHRSADQTLLNGTGTAR